MTKDEAKENGASFNSLTAEEKDLINALGQEIAPPSAKAGLADYIDHHVSIAPEDSLLALRYLDVPSPYLEFYRPALASLAKLVKTMDGGTLNNNEPRWSGVLDLLANGGGDDWQGPPAPLFLFAMRMDAIDIAYGTKAGFDRLGVDYLAHIEPEKVW